MKTAVIHIMNKEEMEALTDAAKRSSCDANPDDEVILLNEKQEWMVKAMLDSPVGVKASMEYLSIEHADDDTWLVVTDTMQGQVRGTIGLLYTASLDWTTS